MKSLFQFIVRLFYPRFNIAVPDHAHTYGAQTVPANIGRRVKRTVVSEGTYQVLPSDEYVVGTTNTTLTLPPADSVPDGWMLMVANAAPGSITVGVVPSGSDTIGSIAGTVSIGSTFGLGIFVADGVDNFESVSVATGGVT